MQRVFLDYRGNQIALTPGSHVIGRGLGCTIRLNDVTVSREHLRLEIGSHTIHATDLGSRNGTRVNGQACQGRWPIRDGDVLHIGEQEIRISIVNLLNAGDAPQFDEDTVESTTPVGTVGEPRKTTGPEEGTRTTRPTSDRLTAIDVVPLSLPRITFLDCPKCRHRVPAEMRACPSCGHIFPRGAPLAITQIIDLAAKKQRPRQTERRKNARFPVDVPLLYVSEQLSLNALAYDLSPGGVYVGTDLLDEVGTCCDITFLPEARPAVQCRGVVRHASNVAGSAGRPPGMGVEFTHLGLGGKEWLTTLIKPT